MTEPKFLIAARNKKGQIGFLSEGLSLPEFAELFKSKGEIRVLVDYSPIIEQLHKIHNTASSEDILKKYNAMFNYWQEAKSHTKESVRERKSEELCRQANFLINDLHVELQKSGGVLRSKWGSGLSELHDIVREIKRDSNIYIDTLLCFIHSKAALDIASFKNDPTLPGYGKFLEDFIDDIYRRLLRDGYHQDSLLKYIAFEQPEKLQDYLDLEDKGETADQYLLRVLKAEQSSYRHDQQQGHYREVSIRYTNFHNEWISIVETFRDLLHKIRSVNGFLVRLNEGEYKWEDGIDFVDELRESVRFLK